MLVVNELVFVVAVGPRTIRGVDCAAGAGGAAKEVGEPWSEVPFWQYAIAARL